MAGLNKIDVELHNLRRTIDESPLHMKRGNVPPIYLGATIVLSPPVRTDWTGWRRPSKSNGRSVNSVRRWATRCSLSVMAAYTDSGGYDGFDTYCRERWFLVPEDANLHLSLALSAASTEAPAESR